MKKFAKTCIALLLLLALTATVKPVTTITQPEGNESGITVLGDDDDENADCFILLQ